MGHHHAEKRLGAADLKGLYQNIDRRNFLNKTAMGMGAIALQQLISPLGANAATMEEQIMSALPTITAAPASIADLTSPIWSAR
jgi:hypothetical protein